MNVQIMSTPCYLLETVELIYAFVNGVPAEELTGPGSYCIPVREVQRIMDTACAGLALQNPTLQFFFQKKPWLTIPRLYLHCPKHRLFCLHLFL